MNVADQVPLERQIGELLDLVQRFLDTILAEGLLSGGRGLAHERGTEGFRDGDEADVVRLPLRPVRRRLETAAHPGETLCQCRLRRHGYLIVARMAFAVSAFSPVGASFRYVWSGPLASAALPSLYSARPNWYCALGYFGSSFTARSK